MKKYPNVAVKIIFKYKDKVLMVRHKDGHFGFPGGRVEWNETVPEALKRELKEELGCAFKRTPELFDIWDYVSKNHRRHSVLVQYIYRVNKKYNFISPEKLQIHWLTRKEIFSKKIIREKEFLDKVFKH